MRPFALYAASCLVIVALLGAIGWSFTGPDGHRMMLVSAALAVVVQLVAFTVARFLQPRHLLLGWGLGSILRFVTLVVYALVVARLWRAPLAPALLSLTAFFFVTTIVEPVFLRNR
ncbi:MAG: hypothetical protein WD801_14840 [Gemmatimonadaceae bacterium]